MKTVVEHKMFFAWNMDKEKAYLEQKSKEGLHLKDIGLGRYVFEVGEPKNMIYQFDFQVLNKTSEQDYLALFEEWELVKRYGGWFYFRKIEDENNNQIYSNIESVKHMLRRLIGFLIIVGVPLYMQLILHHPGVIYTDDFPLFYKIFFSGIYVFLVLYLYALTRLILQLRKLNKSISE